MSPIADTRLVVNAPSVVADTIDGEVVIMNLKSGHYHSCDNVGAVVWAWIEEGRTLGEIERLACRRYDAPENAILSSVRIFVARLREQDLVRDQPAAGAAPGPTSPGATREAFVPPGLSTYTDMQDLLLLDPIHDVDAVGWPKPKDG